MLPDHAKVAARRWFLLAAEITHLHLGPPDCPGPVTIPGWGHTSPGREAEALRLRAREVADPGGCAHTSPGETHRLRALTLLLAQLMDTITRRGDVDRAAAAFDDHLTSPAGLDLDDHGTRPWHHYTRHRVPTRIVATGDHRPHDCTTAPVSCDDRGGPVPGRGQQWRSWLQVCPDCRSVLDTDTGRVLGRVVAEHTVAGRKAGFDDAHPLIRGVRRHRALAEMTELVHQAVPAAHGLLAGPAKDGYPLAIGLAGLTGEPLWNELTPPRAYHAIEHQLQRLLEDYLTGSSLHEDRALRRIDRATYCLPLPFPGNPLGDPATARHNNERSHDMAGETVITVVGNLTADPELRFTPSGAAVANFTIASTPRTFDRQSGEWTDGDALFLRSNIWRQAAENVAETLTKGMRVIAQGRLRQRSFDTKEGEKRTVIEFEVDEIGPALKYATAKVNKVSRSGSSGGGGASAPPADDPWGSAPPSSDFPDEPPF